MATTKRADGGRHAGISDQAVTLRTGKGWKAWFALIDRAGAAKLEHKAIARLLAAKHKVSGWWSQMITVAWEQARGRRVRHQRATTGKRGVAARSFAVSASRTLDVSRAAAWKALTDARRRARWVVAKQWDVLSQKAPARMRIAWKDGTTVEFHLLPKGPRRCQVVADHGKLKDAKTAAWMKACWGRALDRMKSAL